MKKQEEEGRSLVASTIVIAMFMTTMLLNGGCRIEKTEEGSLPDVDVSGSAGKLPDYDVVKKEDGRLPSVDVDVKGGNLPAYEVDLPEVEVKKKSFKVPYPDVDINLPGEKDYEQDPGEDSPKS